MTPPHVPKAGRVPYHPHDGPFTEEDSPQAPETFEALRQYIQAAAEQLISNMAQQQVNYLVPAQNILALIDATARVQGTSSWSVWESWALRHAIPVHEAIKQEKTDTDAMQSRLRDLLGYCILGLVLTERE